MWTLADRRVAKMPDRRKAINLLVGEKEKWMQRVLRPLTQGADAPLARITLYCDRSVKVSEVAMVKCYGYVRYERDMLNEKDQRKMDETDVRYVMEEGERVKRSLFKKRNKGDAAHQTTEVFTLKEVVVYRRPVEVVHIYDVVEHGRRFYRQLVFSSSPIYSLHTSAPRLVTVDDSSSSFGLDPRSWAWPVALFKGPQRVSTPQAAMKGASSGPDPQSVVPPVHTPSMQFMGYVIHSFTHSFIHSFTYSFFLFTRSKCTYTILFTHSFTHSLIN